eukprot:TRINITY_DN35860_c0_g1_i2.p1 TRINITY_DN35860_c0_g1~~TRINITY_DN35860_c0_g1_i2.p1  ORF type:complete len:214 (-),score=37.07 TRINITY_DN35860_c0_g1_i2:34-675(-)
MGQGQVVCCGREKVISGVAALRVCKYNCNTGKGDDLVDLAAQSKVEDRLTGLIWGTHSFPEPDVAVITQVFEHEASLANYMTLKKQREPPGLKEILKSTQPVFDHWGPVHHFTNHGCVAPGAYSRVVVYSLQSGYSEDALHDGLVVMDESIGILRTISMKPTATTFVLQQIFDTKESCAAYIRDVRPRLPENLSKVFQGRPYVRDEGIVKLAV